MNYIILNSFIMKVFMLHIIADSFWGNIFLLSISFFLSLCPPR